MRLRFSAIIDAVESPGGIRLRDSGRVTRSEINLARDGKVLGGWKMRVAPSLRECGDRLRNRAVFGVLHSSV